MQQRTIRMEGHGNVCARSSWIYKVTNPQADPELEFEKELSEALARVAERETAEV